MAVKVFSVLTFIVLSSRCVIGEDITYHISEHTEGDKDERFIGDVAKDSGLEALVGSTDFGNLKYGFLATGSQFSSLFKIDERSSFLHTVARIDRELICQFSPDCVLNLHIAAQSTMSSFFKIIRVNLYIDDVNDNSPTFDKPSITLAISEAVLVGTSITIDGARDLDTSNNYSLQSYSVIPDDSPFSIKFLKNLDGTSTVQLLVKKTLNREVEDSYDIVVIARDGGNPPRTGTLKANITITDVNDNSPTFSSPVYNVTVKEDINVSSVIMTLSANDEDAGKNGKVFYQLSPHQSDAILELFDINNKTGDIIVKKPIVYIPGYIYSIIIEASDMGDQPLTTQTFVHVSVIDVGKSRPVINVNLLSGTKVAMISENADVGAIVAHIAIEDSDTGENGMVTCSVVSQFFRLQKLDNKEFKIVVSRDLDREKKDKHTVIINCQDKGTPPMSANATFVVEVEDENDSPPKFSSKVYKSHMEENIEAGYVIIHIEATDDDISTNGEVMYYIGANDNDTFEVDPYTGVVRNKKAFDREVTPYLSFLVYAIDMGSPALTGSTTVSLVIDDVNDERPVFNQSAFVYEVYENEYADTVVARLIASDKDIGDKGEIVYSLTPGQNQVIPFIIFPGGLIKTDRELDREIQSIYDFTVMAADLGFPSLNATARVTIFVTDKNDNVPVITAPSSTNNTIRVATTTSPKTVITTIRAFDLDNDSNSMLRYYIVNRNGSDLFDLNDKTGILTLKKDISNKSGETVSLEIEATDMGTPRLSTRRHLHIKISSSLESDAGVQNFIIVIVLVAITALSSTGIIVIICILRRKDRIQKHKEKELSKQATFEHSVTVFSLPEDSILNEKKKKKEVSFSLDDEDMLQIADTNHMSMQNNNLLQKPYEPKNGSKKQDDDHSIISGDTNASDSGRGGSDDENHTSRSQQSSGTLSMSSSTQKPQWYDFQRPHNAEMQTFSKNCHRQGNKMGTMGAPSQVRDVIMTGQTRFLDGDPTFLSNSVPNVHNIHVTAEKLQRPRQTRNNISFDSGKFSPAPMLDLSSQDYTDCVV